MSTIKYCLSWILLLFQTTTKICCYHLSLGPKNHLSVPHWPLKTKGSSCKRSSCLLPTRTCWLPSRCWFNNGISFDRFNNDMVSHLINIRGPWCWQLWPHRQGTAHPDLHWRGRGFLRGGQISFKTRKRFFLSIGDARVFYFEKVFVLPKKMHGFF